MWSSSFSLFCGCCLKYKTSFWQNCCDCAHVAHILLPVTAGLSFSRFSCTGCEGLQRGWLVSDRGWIEGAPKCLTTTFSTTSKLWHKQWMCRNINQSHEWNESAGAPLQTVTVGWGQPGLLDGRQLSAWSLQTYVHVNKWKNHLSQLQDIKQSTAMLVSVAYFMVIYWALLAIPNSSVFKLPVLVLLGAFTRHNLWPLGLLPLWRRQLE